MRGIAMTRSICPENKNEIHDWCRTADYYGLTDSHYSAAYPFICKLCNALTDGKGKVIMSKAKQKISSNISIDQAGGVFTEDGAEALINTRIEHIKRENGIEHLCRNCAIIVGAFIGNDEFIKDNMSVREVRAKWHCLGGGCVNAEKHSIPDYVEFEIRDKIIMWLFHQLAANRTVLDPESRGCKTKKHYKLLAKHEKNIERAMEAIRISEIQKYQDLKQQENMNAKE